MVSITCDTDDKEFVQNMLNREGVNYTTKTLCGGYQFDIDTVIEKYKNKINKKSVRHKPRVLVNV